MSHNRYYIINADDPNMNDINDIIVGRPETQRYSIDNSQIVVKLHENDHHQHDCLQQYTEQSHDEILQTMNSPEWTPEITEQSHDEILQTMNSPEWTPEIPINE